VIINITNMKTKKTILIISLFLLTIVLFFSNSCTKDSSGGASPANNGATVKDTDGNVYNTVTIGKQTWMVENLKTTHYNDGVTIPYVSDSADWVNSASAGYCDYNNFTNNSSTYGALYNSYAVNNTAHQLCPKGWHVPTTAEWDTLINYLGGINVAATALKERGYSNWSTPNSGTNSSGFTALPGGVRHGYPTAYVPGQFQFMIDDGGWWTSTTVSGTQTSVWMFYNYTSLEFINESLNCGSSVRCIKNSN